MAAQNSIHINFNNNNNKCHNKISYEFINEFLKKIEKIF